MQFSNIQYEKSVKHIMRNQPAFVHFEFQCFCGAEVNIRKLGKLKFLNLRCTTC